MTATLPTRMHSKPLLALAGALAAALLLSLILGFGGRTIPKPRCTEQTARTAALNATHTPGTHVTYFRRVPSGAWVHVADRADRERLVEMSCAAGRWRVTSVETG